MIVDRKINKLVLITNLHEFVMLLVNYLKLCNMAQIKMYYNNTFTHKIIPYQCPISTAFHQRPCYYVFLTTPYN